MATHFELRLQRVLSLLDARETAAKARFGEINRRLERLRRVLADAKSRVDSVMVASRREIAPEWIAWREVEVSRALSELRDLEALLASDEALADRARRELERMTGRRSALEALRKTRRKEHREQEGRREQRVLDDLLDRGQRVASGEKR